MGNRVSYLRARSKMACECVEAELLSAKMCPHNYNYDYWVPGPHIHMRMVTRGPHSWGPHAHTTHTTPFSLLQRLASVCDEEALASCMSTIVGSSVVFNAVHLEGRHTAASDKRITW